VRLSGGLYNGMVRPFLNMTIKGALWYQGIWPPYIYDQYSMTLTDHIMIYSTGCCTVPGENNAFQCHGANSIAQNGDNSGGPIACGSIADRTGCEQHTARCTLHTPFYLLQAQISGYGQIR
jgi:hypothetical protein